MRYNGCMTKKKIDLDSSGNAVYNLTYHLIVCVKYRKKIFVDERIIDYLKEQIALQCEKFDIEVVEQGVDKDHFHLLFRAKPTTEFTKFVNSLKGVTSRRIRANFPQYLEGQIWGKHFWSPSYYLATSGNVSLERLKKYVESQGAEK